MVELRAGRYTLIALLAGVAALMSLAIWGGVLEVNATVVAGFVITALTIVAFGVLTWFLMFSRIPDAEKVQVKRLPAAVRQLLALLIAGSAVLLLFGLTWDEAWHRTYGVPLGEDFFWRPHILMYVSFALFAVFAFGGLLAINRNPGTFRQKFRAEPLLGLLVLASGFTLVSLPMDPVWHSLYGVDLTAWSLPHLIMFGSTSVIFLIGAALQISVIPKTDWRFRIGSRDLIAVFMLSQAMLITLILLVVEWDGTIVEVGDMAPAFYARPQWLFPGLIVAAMTFYGLLTLRLFRRVGIATLCGVLALITRLIMIQVLGADSLDMTARPQIMGLIPLIVLDIAYFVRIKSADHPLTARIAALAASLIGLAGVLFVIAQWYYFPVVTAQYALEALIFGTILSVITAWYGYTIGESLHTLGGGQQASSAVETRRVLFGGAVGVAAMLAFMAFFVMTATPPVV
jgi:hypothetical protein